MFQLRFRKLRGGRPAWAALTALALACLLAAPPRVNVRAQATPGNAFRQTNLVSDLPGVALVEDRNLVNPWGVALGQTGPFAVADQGAGVATFYHGDIGGGPLVKNPNPPLITIQPGARGGPVQDRRGMPTGVAANTSGDFVVTAECVNPPCPGGPARFIFAALDGSIAAWHPDIGARAMLAAQPLGRAYTGLAIANNGSANFLYAADFANGRVDIYDKNFAAATVAGNFADPTVPAGFHPFNIQNLGGALYVTYAQFNQFSVRPNEGAGLGLVRKFDFNGVRDPAFAINNATPFLNAPWGLALAPAGFGEFGGALLVGNHGDSLITASVNAFDPATGAHRGPLKTEGGADLKIEKLWGLAFGNGAAGGDPGTLYFTAGLDNERHGLFGSLKPIAPGPITLVQFSPIFSPDEFFTREGDGHVDISVRRTGDVTGTTTVNYATFDGPATQKTDYEIALGKLTFGPGERVKSFRVLVVDDNDLGGGSSVQLNLILSNPSGASLGSPHTARLSIMDDEFDTPKAGNPVDDPTFFVRQHYFDFLNREPDAAGLQFWTNQITSCGTNQGCVSVRRINVSAAFFLSIEFQRSGLLAYLADKAAFGALPRYGQFMRGTQALQRDFVFGAPGAEEQLEANKRAFFDDFVARPEFVSAFGGQSNVQYVDALNQNTGGSLTQGERDALVGDLNAGAKTRAQVLRAVAENAEFRRKEFNPAFVLMQYFGYLRRNPDDPPDTDFSGYNFWLTKLNQFGGNFERAEMVKAFITSGEYRRRFRQSVGP